MRGKRPSWDWNAIVGTGQSLSVGATPILSTRQPYHNLKLDLGPGGNASVPPWDPTLKCLAMVPLVEPIRACVSEDAFPSPYPCNIYGETLHSAMANQITFLAQTRDDSTDYVTVHTVVGESGQGIVALKKQAGQASTTTGSTGRAYQATLFEVAAIAKLAKAAGKSYGVAAIVMTHGETDSGSETYGRDLVQLLADYNVDLARITGQTRKIPMYLSQQHAFPNGPSSAYRRPLANQAQWRLGVTHEDYFVCTGPKYQYPGHPDGVHLSARGLQLLGEKVGQIHYETAVLGIPWQPLQPIQARVRDRSVLVTFHVPVPPLVWDATFDPPLLAEWVHGRGFELSANSAPIPIDSVDIEGDSVVVRAASDLPRAGLMLGYALASQGVQLSSASKAVRWGALRDSDPFVGLATGLANPNHCVSFLMPIS